MGPPFPFLFLAPPSSSSFLFLLSSSSFIFIFLIPVLSFLCLRLPQGARPALPGPVPRLCQGGPGSLRVSAQPHFLPALRHPPGCHGPSEATQPPHPNAREGLSTTRRGRGLRAAMPSGATPGDGLKPPPSNALRWPKGAEAVRGFRGAAISLWRRDELLCCGCGWGQQQLRAHRRRSLEGWQGLRGWSEHVAR